MASSPSPQQVSLDRYVVLRGAGRQPWYRRRIPEPLRAALGGASTITRKLAGHPCGTVSERRQYLSAYAQVHGEVEHLLSAAQGPRHLSAAEQLGIAGSWVANASPRPADPTDAAEAAAVLQALLDLGLSEPPCRAELQDLTEKRRVDAGLKLAAAIHGLAHPGRVADPPGALLWGEPDPALVCQWLEQALAAAAPAIEHWKLQALAELQRLGVVVPAGEQLQVAARLAVAADALSQQRARMEAGQLPPPLVFPPPPAPTISATPFSAALRRWEALRRPTRKTALDAEARLKELAAHAGHDRLEALTAGEAGSWRDALLAHLSPATVRRRTALVKAVLSAAAEDDLPVAAGVVERLTARKVKGGADGTRTQRRAFTQAEARQLIEVSRTIASPRPLDRWGYPLGLATGARLEELAGLRPQDVRQIDGIWVVVIEPHHLRRLKNSNSARSIPLPDALIAEGFVTWAQAQSGPVLFSEPEPPAADPRLSHYASIRLSKILRKQAGIADSSVTFHSTRHTTAQHLLDAGIEQRLIEGITGHASRSMVAGYSRSGPPLHLLAAAQGRRDWNWWPG